MAPKPADRLLAEALLFKFPDTDPYELIEFVEKWLGERDAVLTPKGVRKGSDWRKGEA